MSIIIETLRALQNKQEAAYLSRDNPAVNRNIPNDIKPARHSTLVKLTIVLTVLGLATYIGFDKYQNKLKEKRKVLNYNQNYLKTETAPIANVPKSKLGLNMGGNLNSINQPILEGTALGPVDILKDPEETPIALLMEEYEREKQLSLAKRLVYVGSYIEAIKTLKAVIDQSAGTWETYLLTGTAYLGLGELDVAEMYLKIGLSINGKQPQLSIQRAIKELQRGKHEIALQILHESEKLSPTLLRAVRDVSR